MKWDVAPYQTTVMNYAKTLLAQDSPSGFTAGAVDAAEEIAPHKVCAYIYDLANAFNHFYHETKIIGEEDEAKKAGWIALLMLTRDVLETAIDLLGFSAPERM